MWLLPPDAEPRAGRAVSQHRHGGAGAVGGDHLSGCATHAGHPITGDRGSQALQAHPHHLLGESSS